MSTKKILKNPAKSWVGLELDSHVNELLSKSSARSERTKRKEALLRLADHLERFESISHKGEAIARNKSIKGRELS